MRIDTILAEIRKHKTCSRAQLYTYIKALGIEPVGARQRPQRYPADTAQKVLKHLGLIQDTKPESLPELGSLRKLRSWL